jgi:hypothetical protein
MMIDDGPYRHQHQIAADECVIGGHAYPLSASVSAAVSASADADKPRLYRRPVWRKRLLH